MMTPKPLKDLKTFLFLFLSILFFSNLKGNAQQKAFPTAYGGGAYASGGRGGSIYHVTSLEDDGSPGTLRWAIGQPRPATVVFDVSGIIELQSSLQINGNDLTIAGQTAPEGGITITAAPLNRTFRVGDAQNVILRYLRVRMQFYGDTAFTVYPGSSPGDEASNLIFDHISISYAGLQGFTVRGKETHNITFQNGLIAECKTGSLFGDTDPSHAGFSYNNTFRTTLFYNISHRTPNSSSGRADIYNNVIYDWINRWTVVKTNALINHFNNYIFTGNKTSLFYQFQDQDPRWHVNGATNENPSLPPLIYTSGNIVQDLFEDPNADNQFLWIEHAYSLQTERLSPDLFRDTPFPMIGAVPAQFMTAEEASVVVPLDAGASKYLNADGSVTIFRDPQDTRYVNNTINDTPEPWANAGGTDNRHTAIDGQPYADFLASISTTPLNTRPPNFYISNPHIPEIWFQANVPSGQDHNDIAPSGYTWLEEYLNQVDGVVETPDPISVTGVSISPSTATLNINGTTSLAATVTPANASNSTGIWSSEDEGIATVNQSGVVTGIAAGDTTITFTTNDGDFTDTSVITVTSEVEPEPELPLSYGFYVRETMQEIAALTPGETATLAFEDVDGLELSFAAVNTDNFSGSFRIIFDGITKIENVDPYTTNRRTFTEGFHTAQYEIFSELNAQGELLDTIELSVLIENNPVTVTAVSLAPNTAELQVSETIALTATVSPDNATNQTGVWSSSDESIATVDANGVVSAIAEGVVTITFTTDDGGFTDTSEITVFPEALQASAGENQQLCEGDSATLTATGGTNYAWSTGETTATIEVTPNETTIYTVTVSDDNGQTDAASVTVTVNAVPIANAGEDQTICEGEIITLTASGGDSYLWSTGETTASIEVFPTVETIYTVEVTTNNCSSSDSVTVFMNEAPNLTITEDMFIAEGESTTLIASGGDNYEWSTGETTASIIVSPNSTTTFSVSSVGVNGCVSNADVTVTVVPELIANAGNDVSICNGESVTLNASGGSSYIWNTGDTGSTLNVSPSVTTTYTVTVTDVFGNSDSDSVIVTVNEIPNVTISENVTLIEGESTTLTASGTISYLWNTGETSNAITVSPTQTTTYTVTGTSNGCEATAEVTVTVIPELIANAGNDVSICSGESVTLNATGGNSYLWNTGDTGAELSVSPSATTTYTVTVSDAFGNSDSDSVIVMVNEIPNVTISENVTLIEGESTTLTASGTISYLWNTGETSNAITVSPTQTTTYTVTGTSNGCEATAEVTVTVIPELIANAGNDVSICSGESVTLNATGGNSYLWNTGDTGAELSVSPSATTTYTVTVSDAFGNSDSDSVIVTVNEIPNVTVSENITIIEGESTNLIAQGAETYLWNTGQTSNIITVSPTQTTTYVVEGTSNTCSASAEVTVTVEPLFVASAGADERVCEDSSYEVVLTANQGDSYLWSTSETTRSITVSPLSTSTYTVTVTQGTQVDSDTVSVYVDPSPNVLITNGEQVNILSGDFVTLSATGANTYEWNNGATQPNIAVSPSATTTYEVKGFIGQCYEQKQVNVKVYQPVVADAGADVFMCLNEVAILTATGGDDYLWSTGETTQSIEVSPEETTDYTVTVFNPMHFDEDTVTVAVDAGCDIIPVDPETSNEVTFDMFPNPASKSVNLRFSDLSSVTEVNIHDLSGVLVKHIKIDIEEGDNTTKIKLNISTLQAGVYVVKLLYKDNVITKKLIVK